ncbi:MAG: hypothetical protein N4A33_04365 [Bacteriovoracaceae bacterium]|nr:hypothetical protein [Bacteriovoracaceae bacterium]
MNIQERFLFSHTYEDIIYTLGKWRILSLSDLKKKIGYQCSHQAFSKLVRRLEKYEYLESIYYQNYKKYLFLTNKGLKEAGLKKTYPINKEVIQHDLICVNVLHKLLQEDEIFLDGSLSLEDEGRSNRPDGLIKLTNRRKLAIEVELTQKQSYRIEQKFTEYTNNHGIDYVLYLFSRPSVFKAYQKRIDELDRKINPLVKKKCTSKIILMIEPTIKSNDFYLNNADCYFNGRISKFEKIKNQYLV